MKIFYVSLIGFLLLTLTSCIEIIDDITINNDGSGTLKYTVNLSASKVKINSILALDSLEGQRVPSKDEILNRMESISKKLASKPGISNVDIETDMTNFVFKIKCDFSSINALQTAVKDIIREESNDKSLKELEHSWLSWDGNKLVRSIPDVTLERIKNLKQEDAELLRQGNYTSITRFERPVDRFENPNAKLAGNKLAVMIKTNPYLLTQNYNLLENTIYLTPNK